MTGMPDEPVAFTLQDWLRDRGHPTVRGDVITALDWVCARLDQLPLHPADTRPLPPEAFGWNTAVDMIKKMVREDVS